MRISIFGLGYVGVTSLSCLSKLGHDVTGVDVLAEKVDSANSGKSPIYEPGIDELLKEGLAKKTLRATTNTHEALEKSDVCFVCVGTPSKTNGVVDDKHLRSVVSDISKYRAKSGRTLPLIIRSTCLPFIHRELQKIVENEVGRSQPLAYCVHPEFLRAGKGVEDFMNPPKIVFGTSDATARAACIQLYPGFVQTAVQVDVMTAALVKYADNCFHAVKVTFANEIGMLARDMGIDSRVVMDIFCSDTKLNLSSYYLKPGFAFGGSCLPKDLRAVLSWAQQNMVSVPMLEHVLPSNERQVSALFGRILEVEAANSVAIMGLTFKAGTDDVRESPMVEVAEFLIGKGKQVTIYDPSLDFSKMIGSNKSFALRTLPHLETILKTTDPNDVIDKADVVLFSKHFPEVDWQRIAKNSPTKKIIDLMNCVPPDYRSHVEGLYW